MPYKKSRKRGGVKIHPSDKKSTHKPSKSYKLKKKQRSIGKFITPRNSTPPPTTHIHRMIHENYYAPVPALLTPDEFVEHVRQMYLLNGEEPIPLTYEEKSELYLLQAETDNLLRREYHLTEQDIAEMAEFED